MDIEHARYNMIEQQIRPWEVLDPAVLDLLFKVRREDFVPAAYQAIAFVDMEIPLGEAAAMWSPKLEARVLQSLAVQRHERVLEVGTGSGYFTALLASQAGQVVSVEIDPALQQAAEARLKAHGFANITLKQGDAARDWAEDGRFDVIVLTASTPALPSAYLSRLNPGGRLFAIVGDGPAMQAQRITCAAEGAFRTETLFETEVAPLVNAQTPDRFIF